MILGEENVTLRRPAVGSRGSDGRYEAGAATDTTIQMSWQPLGFDDITALTEADRKRQPRKGYTSSEVRTADQYTGTGADFLVVDGVVYEVRGVKYERAVIPHYKVWCVRLQERE